MSVAIWKYTITEPDAIIRIPVGAMILDVATQKGEPTFWAQVDTQSPLADRHFRLFGTGHDINNPGVLRYIGTCHNVSNLGLVFHLFEVSL